MKYLLPAFGVLILSGCASLTNDSHIPVSLSFSDGSSGTCLATNKRMSTEVPVPGTPLIRRSDDDLDLNCQTEDGRTATASVPSSMSGKIVASALFLDFGITDAITDMHREYPASFVILVKPE